MSDFYQTGIIATLHRLGEVRLPQLEAELNSYSIRRPIALIVPSLYSELEQPALKTILSHLKGASYLQQIVIGLDAADESQFKAAREFFKDLPQRLRIVWNDGPRLKAVYDKLSANELDPGGRGKGRNAWMCFGYVLAEGNAKVIALHDADIVSYDRSLLARLCYPVTNPSMGYEYCKGYYARVSDRMHGRVTRIFFTPLIRCLIRILGSHPFLEYLNSYRYPLSGEFAMDVDVARVNRIPSDWGLEAGMLAEVYRNLSLRRVCQVDISEGYEHKHQELSASAPGEGLMKMAIDIAKAIFRTLNQEGVVISDGLYQSLLPAYLRTAQDMIKRYEDDAALNGLVFDRHAENNAAEAFAQALKIAAREQSLDPLGAPQIPNWNRVISAMPGLMDEIHGAVEEDNK